MTTNRSESANTKRGKYSDEFRAEALALAKRTSVANAAKELGLHASQIYAWRTRARQDGDQGELAREQAAEIAKLKRLLADKSEELEIAKKAAVYFAQSLK